MPTHYHLHPTEHAPPQASPVEASAAIGDKTSLEGMGKTLSIQLGAMVLAYVSQVFLARWLGSQEFGLYSVAMTVAVLLTYLAGIGLPTGLQSFLPEYLGSGEHGLARGLIVRSIQLSLAIGCAVAILASPVAWIVEPVLTAKESVMVALVMVPVATLATVVTSQLQVFRRWLASGLPDQILTPVLFLGAVYVLTQVLDDVDPVHALLVSLGIQLVLTAGQLGVLFRTLSTRVREKVAQYRTRIWVEHSLPVLFLTGFGIVLYRADLLIVDVVGGHHLAGVYAACLTTAEILRTFLKSAITAISPKLSPLLKAEDHGPLLALLRKASWASILPVSAGVVVGAIWGREILGLFGDGFDEGYPALVILLVLQWVRTVLGLSGRVLIIAGRGLDLAKAFFASSLVDVALLFVLVPRWGLTGAAAASLVTTILAWGALVVVVRRRLGFDPTVLPIPAPSL